jgi:DNA/RNA endonuclease YhcR with UshA esterase domain
MKDRKTIGCALVCIFCGLMILHITAHRIESEYLPISSLTEGRYAACEGIVCTIHKSKGHTFVQIYDGNLLDVPLFNADVDISVGDLLTVEGEVSEYDGHLQIIPHTYRVLPVIYGLSTDTGFQTTGDSYATQLSAGFHAVIGEQSAETIVCTRELGYPFVQISGVITTSYERGDSYTIVLCNGLHLHHKNPLDIGQLTGYGIPHDDSIILLWYHWKNLDLEPIAAALTQPVGCPVKVCGIISQRRMSSNHLFLVIEDDSGSIAIPIFADQYSILGVDPHALTPGKIITVTGVISQYRGIIEIIPSVIS